MWFFVFLFVTKHPPVTGAESIGNRDCDADTLLLEEAFQIKKESLHERRIRATPQVGALLRFFWLLRLFLNRFGPAVLVKRHNAISARFPDIIAKDRRPILTPRSSTHQFG